MKNVLSFEEIKSIENKVFELKLLVPLFGLLIYIASLFFKFTKYPLTPILIISIIYFLFLILMHLVFKKINENRALSILLFIGLVEIILATLIVYLTGGATSFLFILYILIILNFSAYRYPNCPLLIAIISFIFYISLIFLEYYDIIPYLNYFRTEFYTIDLLFLIQRGLIVGLYFLVFSLYANRIIIDLNKERNSLELLRKGTLLFITYIGDRENFFNSILKIAREVVDADSSSIIEYKDGEWRFVAWDNLNYEVLKEIEESFKINKPQNLEEIREKKCILHFNDVYKVPYWIKKTPLRSYIGAPIILNNEVIGVLNVDSEKVSKFSEVDVKNIDILSKIIATILEKDALFKKIYELNKKLENFSVKDHLTSLYNRRKLEEILLYEINIYLRREENFQIIMLDIDNFKKVNDNLGHLEGDKILIEFGNILNKNSRKTDFVFRYGGDEFIILLPNSPPPTVQIVIERINEKFKEKFIDYMEKFNIGLSFGYLSFKEFYSEIIEKNPDKLYDDNFLYFNVLKYVDDLLYASKKLKKVD